MPLVGWIPDVVPDEPIESAWGNGVRDRTVTPFANAAARNSGIAAPIRGQVVTLDSGQLQVYNGSKWVTVNAQTARVAAGEATSSTSYTNLTTAGPAVTIETGTKALVTITATVTPTAAANVATVGVAVSGATTIAAVDTDALIVASTGGSGWPNRLTMTTLLDALTAGSNTFTLQYKVNAANTQFQNRVLSVVGVL